MFYIMLREKINNKTLNGVEYVAEYSQPVNVHVD